MYQKTHSFMGEIHRREIVAFTPELREQVKATLLEMHELFARQYTPKVKPTKSRNACSLRELCLSKLCHRKKVRDYLRDSVEEIE